MEWTEKMEETLDLMWAEGHSCSIIGKRIGVSPSAVAGKAHRRGLERRRPAIAGDGPEMQRRREASKMATIANRRISQGLSPIPPRRRTADKMPVWETPIPAPPKCCWPLGVPKTKSFRFCGAKPEPGKPYCAEHCQLAYIKPHRDRRELV